MMGTVYRVAFEYWETYEPVVTLRSEDEANRLADHLNNELDKLDYDWHGCYRVESIEVMQPNEVDVSSFHIEKGNRIVRGDNE
jgi:hypothetical protein